MLKDKKMMFFLLAANSILSASAYGENFSDAKYEKLYDNMVKNIQTGKSNDSNNKVIESILKKRNKELKDLYKQNDYIVKPEYLEWQIFASGFYAERDRGYDSDKYGDGSNQKNSSQVNGTDLRTGKQVQVGATIPIKLVNDFVLEPEISINKKKITVDSIQAPTVVPKIAPTINIPNVNLPVINITQPAAVASPQVVSPDINLISSVLFPTINLQDITIVDFNLATASICNTVQYCSNYGSPPSYTSGTTINVTNAGNPGGIAYYRQSATDSYIDANITINRDGARGVAIDEGENVLTKYTLVAGRTITMNGSENAAIEILGTHERLGAGTTLTMGIYNGGTIIGNGDGNGNIRNQAAFLFNSLDSSSNNTRTYIENSSAGTIILNAPESVGIQLRPDPGEAVRPRTGITEQGVNKGNIIVNGYRSYGMMTSALSYSTLYPYNDGGYFRRLVSDGSFIRMTGGTITINGDESSGFSIQRKIQAPYFNSGSILIGVSAVSQTADGNLPGGDATKVERAMGVYSNQPSDALAYGEAGDDGVICTSLYGCGYGGTGIDEAAIIRIGQHAVQSSGVRVEGEGLVTNYGSIYVEGSENYGIVVNGSSSRAIIGTNATFSSGVPPFTISNLVSENVGKVEITSEKSIGALVKSGSFENSGFITINGNNSIGVYSNNGNISSSYNNSGNFLARYTKIETTGIGSHAVILDQNNGNSTGLHFNNKSVIKNNTAGTIGIYANGGATFTHTWQEFYDPNESGQPSYLVPIVTASLESSINSGNGAVGIYVEGNNTVGDISGIIRVLGSTSSNTGIGVYSDGLGVVKFNSQTLKASGGSTAVVKNAELHIGTTGVTATSTVGLYSKDSSKFSDVFKINHLDAYIYDKSVLAYLDHANANISNLDNVNIKVIGENSVLLYGANNSNIVIDSNLTVPITGGIVASSSQAYVAENSKVTLNSGKTLESNTKTGLSAFSENGKYFNDGTSVVVDKTKTGVTNKGTVTMNTGSSVGLYTLYGGNLNDLTGVININSTAVNGVGMYSEEEADIENKGVINLKANDTVGMYGKGDSAATYSSFDNINILNTGTINLDGSNNIGISADNNKLGAVVGDAVITNNASGSNKIFVNGSGSVGIYAPFTTVNQNGNIKLTGTNTVGVYGTNGALINGGGIIELNTTSQSQIAYYLEGSTTKLTGSLGDITGHGIAVLSDGAVIDNSIPLLDLTTSAFSDGGAGKIALVLQGATTFGYTNDIKVGDSVDINSDGDPDHYAVALYTDNQNLSSGIANNLTAGANGVGLYAQNGSNIKYSGSINVGNNTTAGTGVYIGSNLGTGSNVTLDNAVINLNGAGGIGAYVENLSTLTFQANSTMNFSGDGVGIYGVQGAIINDNGGVINSNGYAVERTRIQGGIININSNVNVSGGSILGHAVNGEVNVMPGITVTASGDDVIGIFGDGLKGAGTWTQTYEANNLGTIDFSSSNKATAIYLNNARGENKGTIKVNNDSIAFYGQGAGAEIYNNGLAEVGNNSVGLYGNDADLIENLSGAEIKDRGTSNTGIYSIRAALGNTAVKNSGLIELGNDGVGIYAENSIITNTGNIIVGDKVNKNSLGIYAKDSTLNESGSVTVGNSGIAYYGDNSILNLNAASINIGNNGVLAYGINNTTINYNLGNRDTSENTFIYLINSDVDFNNSEITVSKNGLGVYQEGTSTTLGYNKLYIKENGAGIYGYQTTVLNVGDIELSGKNSVGLIAEDSDVTNNTLKNITINESNSVGIYSILNSTTLKTVDNNGEINVAGDKSIGIYGNTLNSAGVSLGTIEIRNNNSIKLGNASTINNAIIGIYGTEGVEINTSLGSTISGGNNVVGLYSDNGKVNHQGSINVQENSVGIYASGSVADIDSNSSINVGSNGAVALYVNDGGILTNNSSNITVGSESIIGYSKDSGTLLENKGNLSIGTESVAFYSSAGEIKNSGSLISTGDGVIFFYGNSGKITNTGVINGAGNGYGVGIYGKSSEIINTNNIDLGDSKIVNPSNPSDSNNRYSVGIYGDNSKIYNDGNISLGESGIGIYSYRQSDDLINDSNALITSNKDKAIGILAEIGNGKKVINKGEINLSGNESIGIALNNGVILENSGKIQVSGDKSIGIMATKDSEIYNTGIIDASGNESIAVLLRSNSKLINTGTISLGSGTLGVVADDDSSVSGFTSTSLESTSVKIPSIANVPTYKPPTIVNAGVIQVGEKFEVPYDGVVQVKVDPDTVRTPTSSEVSTSDLAAKFLVSNAVKFIAPEFNINDVTVTSDFTQGTSSKTYKLADVFIPSTPEGGINSGIATILSQSYTWDATPVTNSNGNIDIWMQKIEYGDLLAGYWNEDFGKALDGKYENADGDALKIFNKIDRLENERDFKHIMSSLAGNIYANINQRENDIASVFENSLDLLENSENNTKENVKVNIIGGKGRTNEDTDGVVGYDYTTTGVLGLREVERTYKQTFGYSLGYLHTGFEFKDGNESEEWVDTIQAGVHNKYKFNDWKLRNDLTGRVSFHNVDRNLDWPSPNNRSEMNGTYETYSITSNNILGREISLGKKSSLTPYGGFKVMYVTRPTFSESGLESLEVEGNDAWSVKPRAGIELQTAIPLGISSGWQLKGKLDFAYEYELANLNEKEKARLIAIEDGYHNLAKPEEENGQFKTRASLGVEVNERYGLFLNGEYTFGEHNQDEYRAGMTLKVAF
ncbi:autotransporter domain-containing protein [Sebaldella sp. S0638]|uniref:autotransporter domain-containing protein n=1 Tax=Sebaldella sp. S0638 TaxID=2957809 RepID=UPI0020A20336|nr:autotransporter domain-containing protein [Sebaldella sp. S0638]MCP1225894.1 autotransporter domain-containing protein [Sebaldella sp. S0638]